MFVEEQASHAYNLELCNKLLPITDSILLYLHARSVSHIGKQFKLKNGDRVQWDLVVEHGEMVIRLKPIKWEGKPKT